MRWQQHTDVNRRHDRSNVEGWQVASFMQILSPVRALRGRIGRRWQEDWPRGAGENAVSFLICSHERINTSYRMRSKSRARPRGPVTRLIGTRVHLPILPSPPPLSYAMHKYQAPQQCPTHTVRVYTHNTRENASVHERREEENRGRRLLHCFMNIICTIAPCRP